MSGQLLGDLGGWASVVQIQQGGMTLNFGDIVGQLIQQGVGGQTQNRLNNALGSGGLGGLLQGAQGGGLQDMLGKVLGGAQGGASQGGLGGLLGGLTGGQQGGGGAGGLLESIGGLLGNGQGGMSGATKAGGIGALAGALLGGGGGAVKGAIGGSAMAVLGTLAMSALKNWQGGQASGAQASAMGQAEQVTEAEIQSMTAPQTAELCLKGMIAAAKSDGQIQDDEMQRIVGKLNEGGVSDEEREFVLNEMRKPLDVQGLVREIPSAQVGAQVYASALMAINVDTANEQAFLRQLAQGVGLDQGTVGRLHQMVGAPAA